ncbi:MAG: class I SAM-dependent methyltransferase, partial [bacterium]|nr:class I SAM-dependent methyltransferase [bacterium]
SSDLYLKKYCPEDKPRVFDSGCGTGRDIAYFENGVGMYISLRGLELCRKECKNRINGSVNEIPVKDESFDIVLSMDVLQHRGIDEDRTISEYHRILSKNGILIMNLPAFDMLYSYHDFSVDTKHRYSRMEIKRLLKGRFEVTDMVFWNGFLFLPGAASRILKSRISGYEKESDVGEVNNSLNRIGSLVLRLEGIFTVNNLLPVGFSILTVARKTLAESK